MKQMTPSAVERAMKLQDAMLRAIEKQITWLQAAFVGRLRAYRAVRKESDEFLECQTLHYERFRGLPMP